MGERVFKVSPFILWRKRPQSGKCLGENVLRPSRAAAWISYLDACEGSILQFVWDLSTSVGKQIVDR